jgi:oligopeptide transport system ATP-binding protein
LSTDQTVTDPSPGDALLRVRDLTVEYSTGAGRGLAVDSATFEVRRGEVLGIVGESGSGKSVTAKTITGLLPQRQARVVRGEVLWKGRDLLRLRPDALRAVRGRELSLVFQDPLSSLNPVFTVGYQISETLRRRAGQSRADAKAQAVALLDMVGVPDPRRACRRYPHQLSGGMRQRAMIAMALALEPDLLIADEPTTALDVTIQAQIMDLMRQLKSNRSMSMILITHDLGVLAEVADRVVVMYAGRVVETGPIRPVYTEPAHPYTLALLETRPSITRRPERLETIGGLPPSLLSRPSGCPFHTRCRFVVPAVCATTEPPLRTVEAGRASACHYAERLLAPTIGRQPS